MAALAPGMGARAQSDTRDLDEVVARPDALADFVTADVRYRRALGFQADREYVESLWSDLSRTVGHRSVGVLLTPDEWQEFVARERLNEDIDRLYSVFAKGEPARDNFGGMMIDHAAGGVLAVYLLDTSRRGWADQLAHQERLEIRQAARSYDDLRASKRDLTDAWIAGAPGTGNITGIGLDIRANSVRVYFEPDVVRDLPPGELPSGFANRFGRDGYIATPGSGAKPTDADLNAKGGWTYDVDTSGLLCTLGLSVRDPDLPTRTYSLSAGHCVNNYAYDASPTIYHNYGNLAGEDIGKMVQHSFQNQTNADAAYFRIYDASQDGDDFASVARVVHGHGGNPYALKVTDSVAGHTEGSSRCHTGRGEGDTVITHCGPITDESYNAYFEGTHINDQVVFDAHASDGDSGGPAYWLNPDNNLTKGAGVESGVTGGDTFYTTISHALNARDWDIYLATDTGSGCDFPSQNRSLPACADEVGGDYDAF